MEETTSKKAYDKVNIYIVKYAFCSIFPYFVQ